MNRDDAAKAAARKAFEADPYSYLDADDYAKDWLAAEHLDDMLRFGDAYSREWDRLNVLRNAADAETRQGML